MSKTPAVRKKKESKSKGIKVNELISSKESATTDISKYLVKQPEYEVDCNGCDVSVPCPDDAALPCSTLSPLSNEAKKKTSIVKPSNPGSRKKNRKPNHGPRSSQITDFFPVRRSSRKTSKLIDKNKVIEDAILSGKEEGFEIKVYPDKGRGVITTKAIKRGEFVLEYYGELIDYEEAKRRETIYSDKENIGCYMYYFKIKNKQYCIDATKESDRLGRLVNHSKKGNLKTRTFLLKESPHLVLFADRDIQPGEELSYDYGDRRKTVLESHPCYNGHPIGVRTETCEFCGALSRPLPRRTLTTSPATGIGKQCFYPLSYLGVNVEVVKLKAATVIRWLQGDPYNMRI